MKTTSNSIEILMILVLIAPFVYLGFIWNQLPADITMHYSLQGNADDKMPKESAVILMGVMSVVLYVLLRFLPTIDTKRRLQSANYQKLRFIITATLAAITAWIWYTAGHQGSSQHYIHIILAIISLLVAGVGNYITTIKPNWFVGIRTPWTLGNEAVWRKTHQMGGRVMVAGGLLGVVLALVVAMPYTIGIVGGLLAITTLTPVVYSYIYFRQEKTRQLN